MKRFIRTCQECGRRHIVKDPATYSGPAERWRDVKCRRCGSVALDYGRWEYDEEKSTDEGYDKLSGGWIGG